MLTLMTQAVVPKTQNAAVSFIATEPTESVAQEANTVAAQAPLPQAHSLSGDAETM